MSVITEDTWEAVMCPACQWNTHDWAGSSARGNPAPRWCPECERHHHVRRELTLVTLTALVRT